MTATTNLILTSRPYDSAAMADIVRTEVSAPDGRVLGTIITVSTGWAAFGPGWHADRIRRAPYKTLSGALRGIERAASHREW